MARQAEFVDALTPEQQRGLRWDWQFWARDKQLPPPGPWRYWLILAGRGFGKTRTGAEWVRQQVKRYPLVNLIGATADDARDIMIEGESGILAICPKDERPEYQTSKRRLVWPNGARSLIFTADEPERLRGKQHMKLWADELCSWRYPEAWDQAMFGLRLGDDPQACITTTPRPTAELKKLLKKPGVIVTTGTTYENRANLAPAFYEDIITEYEGTRLGRQELEAVILDDAEGALWRRSQIEDHRIKYSELPDLVRVVVAVDPPGGAVECGILAGGLSREGHIYVLVDASLKAPPHEWAGEVVSVYDELQADRIVGEKNFGGDMVESTIRSVEGGRDVSYRNVTASRGKAIRAEPVSSYYQRGLVHHVGTFPKLEDEMCQWEPNAGMPSPNRLDALVWMVTELKPQRRSGGGVHHPGARRDD
jgi:phage terminase large subunit-like protein